MGGVGNDLLEWLATKMLKKSLRGGICKTLPG